MQTYNDLLHILAIKTKIIGKNGDESYCKFFSYIFLTYAFYTWQCFLFDILQFLILKGNCSIFFSLST